MLAEYTAKFNRPATGRRQVGLELELPVADREFDQFLIQDHLARLFGARPGWQTTFDCDGVTVVGVTDPQGRQITTDSGLGALELIFNPMDDLNEADLHDRPFLEDVCQTFAEVAGSVLGSGAQPALIAPRWARKKRYEVIRAAVPREVEWTTLTASSQAHVDVSVDEFTPAINVTNALSGAIIALCANSPVWQGHECGLLARREVTYSSFAPERSGMTPRWFDSLEEYVKHLASLPLIVIKRDGLFYPVLPAQSYTDFVRAAGTDGAFTDYWPLHEGMIWLTSRARSVFGTIEVRPACAQPHRDFLVVAALVLGLIESLQQAEVLCRLYPWSDWQAYREGAIKHGLRAKFAGSDARPMLKDVLSLATEGLRRRGLGEQRFLDPLWQRFQDGLTPADRQLAVFRKGGLPALIDYTAAL